MAERSRFSEKIANEPDPLRRMILISFNMDALRDPEEAILSYPTPEGFYAKWSEEHYRSLIQRTAKRTGIDPAILADKENRTPEQAQAIIETSAREQIARLERYLGSNFVAATSHISDYCMRRAEAQGEENVYDHIGDTSPSADPTRGELLNVPFSAALYFFASHATINPQEPASLTDDDKAELIQIFDRLDAFYMEHRDDLKSELALLSAFLDSLNPKDPEAAKEALAQVHQIRKATAFTINNAKAFNVLLDAFPEGETTGQLKISVHTDQATKQEVITYMALTYNGADNIVLKGRRAITAFDKAVYNTVSTLYAAGNRQFSVQDVFRTMNGNTRNSPSKAQIQRITSSLDKMSYTALYMDVTDEMTKGGLTLDDERITRGEIKSPMLHTTSVTAQTENGRTITVYRLLAEPILYTYCKSKRQIITVPIALLDTSEATKSTETMTAIREYLIQQIELMKHNLRNNATIRYATIYEKTDTPAPENRKDAGRMRNQIKAVLDVWTKRGYIKGFTDAKEGRSVTGITILYDTEAQDKPANEPTPKTDNG